MHTPSPTPEAPAGWRLAFAAMAVWTLLGAVPGFLDPLGSFVRFQGHPPATPLELELYRGAWGQTLLFAVGYAFAAVDPRRHLLLLVLGATGKLLYALRLAGPILQGGASALTVLAAVGDLLFVALVGLYLLRRGGLGSLVRPWTPAATP